MNNIGDEGMKVLAKGLEANSTLLSLDLFLFVIIVFVCFSFREIVFGFMIWLITVLSALGYTKIPKFPVYC